MANEELSVLAEGDAGFVLNWRRVLQLYNQEEIKHGHPSGYTINSASLNELTTNQQTFFIR